MAKTNFAYEKRQRELEKKKKQEEKARRKAELKNNPGLAQESEEDLAEGETSGLAPDDD
ncbi:hypothetical protein FHW83_000837 [Duganella sp. SG902]|uniref:hypothetical protein n=1 Tax=Duganella sp. SG902 TaxID=2587016 RepID=UPI00159D2109|nr:hypothetical protein [Duganella sp. SG902]NVM75057.1 hypothetical protein [Duganella sp. SG902]